MSTIQTETRNAGFDEIVAILKDQRLRRLDLVTTAPAIAAVRGMIEVRAGEAVVGREGVTDAAGTYRPTKVFDEGIAGRLGIPGAYLSKLREGRHDLYDANVNGWLHGGGDLIATVAEGDSLAEIGEGAEPVTEFRPDGRKHLLRLLRGDEGEPGVARAFLSPKFRIMDNLDLAVAIAQGIAASGIRVVPTSCDLSDRRMYLRFACPEIWAASPHWLQGYRDPFGNGSDRIRAGRGGASHQALWQGAEDWASTRGLPVGTVVGLGLVASNSDVGGGARYLAPQARVVVCTNGQTITKDASRRVHLGSEMEAGVIEWSTETAEMELDLIRSQTTDAVRAWMTQEYLDETVAEVEAIAGHPIRNPEVTVKEIVTAARFTQADADNILAFMLEGGQGATAGALGSAMTAYAQTVDSPELAFDLERAAFPVMEKAAARR
jgi:hypothetical protein